MTWHRHGLASAGPDPARRDSVFASPLTEIGYTPNIQADGGAELAEPRSHAARRGPLDVVSLDQTDEQVGAKAAGDEPLPGYRLIEPLGRGGFGEVWKCEAPGGLFKAIKFVAENHDSGGSVSLRQEFKAFQRIKAIRHP